MTSPRELLEQAGAEQFFDEDEEPIELMLLPGLDAAGVRELEAELGMALPREIDELVRFARGFEFGPVDTVAFDAGFTFGMEGFLPRVTPLCGDGFGNFWVVEVHESGAWGPVYFVNHDPPVLVVQSKRMAEFIDSVLSLGRPERTSAIDEVHDAASIRIWQEDPFGKPASSLATAGDPTLRAFASSLNPDDLVFDLRERATGSGFAWGRHGPNGDVRRNGHELIFSLPTPTKKPGIFARMFGK